MNNPGEELGKGLGISTPLWLENPIGENSAHLHKSFHIHRKEKTTMKEKRIGHSVHLLPHFHRYYYY